jgi:hypothetical protein
MITNPYTRTIAQARGRSYTRTVNHSVRLVPGMNRAQRRAADRRYRDDVKRAERQANYDWDLGAPYVEAEMGRILDEVLAKEYGVFESTYVRRDHDPKMTAVLSEWVGQRRREKASA